MQEKVIEIHGLTYTYPDGTPALTDVHLDVLAGESLALIGANGAGKSTLLLHLNGILNGNGHVRICCMEVGEKTLPQVRQKVGLVFQDPDNQLFMPTVYDDVAFGPINLRMARANVDAAVHTALKAVDMEACTRRSAHHLSVGEKKRVAIATVLSMTPEILVLDEPTSNLDPRHRRELIALINGFTMTKVIATHDLEFALRTCSRAAILAGGRIAAVGAAREILQDEGLLERYGL